MPSPGVQFLIARAPRLLALFAGGYLVKYALKHHFDISVSTWGLVLGGIVCFPVGLALSVWVREQRLKREAASMGAELIKPWEGKWPGNIDNLIKVMTRFKDGYPGEGVELLINHLGPVWRTKILGNDEIFTCHPDHIKSILATDFNNFVKGEVTFQQFAGVLGNGVFNSDGEMWKFHRIMTRPYFSKDRIVHFDIFERHTDEAIALMKKRLREGYPIDIQNIVSRFTMDSATEFLFGDCVNSLHTRLPYPHNAGPYGANQTDEVGTFSAAFAEVQNQLAQRVRLPSWQLGEIFKDKTAEPYKTCSAYLDPIVDRALAKKKAIAEGKMEKPDEENACLLDNLIQHTDDHKLLKDETLNILIAGRDTTAATLTFAVYLLAENHHVLLKLRKEVLERLGKDRRPTYEDIKEMKYLRAVINETLRLFPAVPFNRRSAIKATTLNPVTPGGKPLYVAAGQAVSYSVLAMHRRKDLWGPDANDFDPDRFLDERLNKYLTPNPFIFLPFNAGPRICLGQQFAYNEASFMICRLLQNFDKFTLDLDAQPLDARPPAFWKDSASRAAVEKIMPKSHLTIYAHGGVWVKMSEPIDEINMNSPMV